MALWEFTNLNKHGNFRTRIIHTEGALNLPGGGLGKMVFVKRFKYEYKHPIMAPTLLKKDNKTYLMPYWKEVENGTTLNDIEWVKPKPKVKQEPIIEIHESSSSDKTYKTTYYPESGKFQCSCPGSYRAFDRRCKHIKELEKKVK
jgi:hypothetical protein